MIVNQEKWHIGTKNDLYVFSVSCKRCRAGKVQIAPSATVSSRKVANYSQKYILFNFMRLKG